MRTLHQSETTRGPVISEGRRDPSPTGIRGTAATPQTADVRESVRRAVLAALDGPGGIILGPAGVGKTMVAREAVELHPGAWRVHLRGSAIAAQTSYGALGWLLSDLPPEDLTHPAVVIQALESLLIRQAAGRRIIMVIDNAEDIDGLSAFVASQLCRRGTVALLLIAGELNRCHTEIVRMCTEDFLKRVDVVPLDFSETGEVLAAQAGAPLTFLARQILWDRSGGNLLLASLMCRDHIAAKSLVLRRGYWTWAGPVIQSGESLERVETVLQRCTPDERHAVELLALCRELPLESVRQLVPPPAVDALEERSVVSVGGGAGQPVRLTRLFQSAAVTAGIPFLRSRDLWARTMRVIDPHRVTGAAAAGLADWTLSLGITLDADLALAAAQWSIETGAMGDARLYARAVTAPQPLSAALAEAAALRNQGNHRDAYRILSTAEAVAGNPAELRIRLLTERALAAARISRCTDDPWSLLEQAEQLIPEDPGARPGPRMQLTLARAELLSLAGRLGQLQVSLPEDFDDPAAPPVLRLWAGIRLAQQHADAGRFAEATELVELVRIRLGAGLQADVRTRELFFHHLFFLLIRCGELGEALILTESAAQSRGGSGLRLASGVELPAGLVHAYAGRGDMALKYLVPALAQLESHDPDTMLPLVVAAAAYAWTLKQDAGMEPVMEPAMEPVMEMPPESGYRTDPPTEAAVRYFQLLSVPMDVNGSDRTAEDLHAHAAQTLADENLPDALLSYSSAALRGHRPASAALAPLCAAVNGTLGIVLRSLAAGLLDRDVPALLTAGETALGQRNSLRAYGVARAACGLLDGSGRPALRRQARQLEYESFRELSPANSTRHMLSQLGDFERELALRAAAGETSGALGQRFELSPRTVEWHLGRVFARLHVLGRTDLRNALSKVEDGAGS